MKKGEIIKKDKVKFLGKEFTVLKRDMIENRSFCNPVNNNAGEKLKTTKEKRIVNLIVGKYFLNEKSVVLDAYGGYGLTTYIWLKEGSKVDVIEQDENNYSLLWDNLDEFHGKRKLRCFCDDNIRIMKALIDKGKKYDLIDIDPYDSPYKQIPLALKLIDKGLLLITCGEPSIMYRRFHDKAYIKRYGSEIKEYFSYKTFWKFPRDFLFEKYIKSFTDKKLELVHYILSKVIGRLIIKVGDFELDKDFLNELKVRKRVFGDISIYHGQNSLNNFV